MKKTKSDGVYFFWSAAILLCMLLAIFALIFTSCAKSNGKPITSPSPDVSTPGEQDPDVLPPSTNDDNPTPPETDSPDTPPQDPVTTGARLAVTEDMGQEYIDKFHFFGDSTTNGMITYAKDSVSSSQVWTPASGTLTLNRWSIDALKSHVDGTELPMADTFAALKPEYLLITLGANGISFMDETAFVTDYTNMVKAIQAASPDTKIILNSIYPTCSDYEYKDSISLEKILAANGWIEKIAGDLSVRFLNSYETLAGADGYLPKELSNGDGIHLNTDGFNKIFNYIRTHGWQ